MSGSALVLHDDEPTLALVRSLVLAAGFEPSGFSSVYSLMLSDGPPSPELVVLGLTAIDARDMEIVAVLRNRWPSATLLVLYPASLRERAARALAIGADVCLPEPFYSGELAAIARRAAQPAPEPVPSAAPAPNAAPATVAQLAADVAHSIRNPLQILELHLGAAEPDGKVDVAAMREALQRIADVVDGLTREAGAGGVASRTFDMRQLVEDVFGQPTPAGSGPTIVVHPGTDEAPVVASHELLRAAFETLRSRALRVTPPSGRIEVTTRVLAEDAGRLVEVAVNDGGPTLSDNECARLFEPRTDAGGAADVDLAGPAAAVREHQGTIVARPAEPEGTSIVIRLPLAAGGEAGRP